MKKCFNSVSEMVNAGYCLLSHTGRIVPIPEGTRIGIPDDDVPLGDWECPLMEAAAKNFRDEILIGLSYRVGGRINQVLWIGVWDIDFVLGRVFINRLKEGIAFYRELEPEFLNKLTRYIKAYGLTQKDYLFCIHYVPKSEKWERKSHPFRKKCAWDIIIEAAERAGIQYRYVDETGELRYRVHPHTSKYTFCSIGYDETKDIYGTALAVGNKSIACMLKSYIFVPVKNRHAIACKTIKRMFHGKKSESRPWSQDFGTLAESIQCKK